jgi:arsenate reductase (thioredoxin)
VSRPAPPAAGPAHGRPPAVEQVVFACAHDDGESQMAAAFFNLLADPHKATAMSAGPHPGERVQPEVVAAMKEVGVDLSAVRPRLLTGALVQGASLLVTMGGGDDFPYVLGLRVEEWPLGDRPGDPLQRVRALRDDLGRLVAQLVSARRWFRPATPPARRTPH